MSKMATVGLRELKARLGRYLRQVRHGHTLIITDRGEPVAELRPTSPRAESEVEVWERWVRSGLVAPFENRPLRPRKRLRLKGPPLSQTISEDRAERF